MQQCYIQIKNSIQKQFKYQKGFQIEYFINTVVVFCNMCTHTRTLRMICLGEKKTRYAQGEMKNKKIPGRFFHYCRRLCPHHLQSYCQICPRKQSLRGEEKNLGKNSTVAQQSSQYEKADIMWTFAVNFVFAKYGERFVNGQKIREGGVKQAFAVNFPHSIVQGHQENAQSFSGTSFRTFPIAMVLPRNEIFKKPLQQLTARLCQILKLYLYFTM